MPGNRISAPIDPAPPRPRRQASAQARREVWGVLPGGEPVEAVTLSDGGALTVRVLTLGATIQSIRAPDRDGAADELVLGHDHVDGYLAERLYYGATVGRFANRIAGARFALDGQEHVLDANQGAHHLHGGANGFDRRNWTVASTAGAGVRLDLVSEDGEGGHPGRLVVAATFAVRGDVLRIDYAATTTRPTVVSLTSHGYFNLAGVRSGADVSTHRLTLAAGSYLPVDTDTVPTGEIWSVDGTTFDFRAPAVLGERLRLTGGFDHCFAIDGPPGVLRPAARLEEPRSGRVLELATTAPGLQLYTGDHLAGAHAWDRRIGRHAALCLEPQAFPDAPNRPHFPSARLDPERVYRSAIEYRFSVAADDEERGR